ncbi:MAG TPA: hypothetical protein PKD70_13175, partial [Saprospiraceae bacterium]|nr:hypothetical protein [Saprospiraceae bacterium]
EAQIRTRDRQHQAKAEIVPAVLKQLQQTALSNQNIFTALMEATKHCTLGQVTHALYEVGGQYRRNM